MTFCPVGVTAATPYTTLEFTFANVSPTTTESGTINLLKERHDKIKEKRAYEIWPTV